MTPGVQGTYQIAYQGRYGSRTATVRLQDGTITGMDTGGGIWKGRYKDKGGSVQVEMTVSNPGLDGGTSVLDGWKDKGFRQVVFELPPCLGEVRELNISTNHGSLRVFLERLAD
jgi:hypothetical protein